MTHYLLSVHGAADRAEFGDYGSKQAMEEAFAATGAFNDQLDVALRLAADGSRACRGKVEVRPFDGLA